jgi:hypothetical protein
MRKGNWEGKGKKHTHTHMKTSQHENLAIENSIATTREHHHHNNNNNNNNSGGNLVVHLGTKPLLVVLMYVCIQRRPTTKP